MTAPTAAASERPRKRELFSAYRRRKGAFAVLVGAVVLEVALGAMVPLAFARGIDHGVLRGDERAVLLAAGVVALVTVAQAGTMWVWQVAASRVAQVELHDLRIALLRRLFGLDADYFSRTPTGVVVSRLTSDVENVQLFLESGVPILVRAALLFVTSALLMVVRSPLLSVVAAAFLVPLVVSSAHYGRRAFEAQTAIRVHASSLLGRLNETMTASAVIQAFNIGARRREAFLGVLRENAQAHVRAGALHARHLPVAEAIPSAALAAVLAIASVLVARGEMTIGSALAFALYLGRLFEPVQQFTELSYLVQATVAGHARVLGFLGEQPVVCDLPDAGPLPPGPGVVVVEGVTFRYGPDGPDVLHGIDLRFEPRSVVALVGRSGSGKSTLGKLLVRLHDPADGRVLVDGRDIKEVTAASLRARVVLVPQQGYLFDGTVADNIAVSRPGASRAEVEESCSSLGVLDRLAALPDGLDTTVLDGGATLSSGQRQLVALARAWLAAPDVVILDEAMSQLDPATEAVVERALRLLLRGRTSIVIAHQPWTAMHADRVIVLDSGEVVEDGEPSALLALEGHFARWASASRGP